MKIPENTTSKKSKEKNQIKNNNEQNDNTFNNNTLSPMQNFPQSENMENIAENINNISNNENNVIANILQTNKIENDINNNNNNDLENNKIKNKKLSKEYSILYNEYDQPGNFNFINISETVEPFIYQKHSNNEYSSHAFNNFKFLDIINSYKMIINIIVDDDSLFKNNI